MNLNSDFTLDRLAIRLLIRCMTFDGVRIVVGFNVSTSSVFEELASLSQMDGAIACFIGVGLVSADWFGVTFSELLDELMLKKKIERFLEN